MYGKSRYCLFGFILFLGILFPFSTLFAQHQEITEIPQMWKGSHPPKKDTNSLQDAFRKGKFNGHLRYFYMNTQNNENLSDYYANAGGGGIRYETLPIKGFQFAVSGFFIFNLGSSDLALRDSLTNAKNRYEIGLFDVSDPKNTEDLDRLEEFYVKYNFKSSQIVFGRQLINTPFINLQDGRMRATGVEGAWLNLNKWKNTKINGGIIWGISPRSTTKWYGIGESIGLYGAGVNETGNPNQFVGKIQSDWLLLTGIHHTINKNVSVRGWNMYVQNLFNISLIQTDYTLNRTNSLTYYGSLQLTKQFSNGNGGSQIATEKYMNNSQHAFIISGRIGTKIKNTTLELNYTHISNQGQYIMPREWGRDPFFTFMPRERNEGLANVQATNFKIKQRITTRNTLLAVGGYYQLPSVYAFSSNKYGMPSYLQFNLDWRHDFQGYWKGIESQILLVYKSNLEQDIPQKYQINKVNLLQINVVLNYHF